MSRNYIKEFKSNLKDLENLKKDEILKEINSIINKNDTYNSLVKRLGTPIELANNYTQDLPKVKSLKNKIISNTKNIISILFIFIMLIVILIYFFINKYVSDSYNYSKYNYKTINQKENGTWISINDISKININQAKVVFYGSKNNAISYTCKGEVVHKNNTLSIKQASCIIKLAKSKLIIQSYQSSIHLIEPKNELILKGEQSNISLDTKTVKYNFDKLIVNTSILKDFKSYKNGISIEGDISHTIFKKYEY